MGKEIQISTKSKTCEQIIEHAKKFNEGLELELDKFDGVYNIFDLIKTCAARSRYNPDWGVLAGRMILNEIKKTAGQTFSEATRLLKNQLHPDYYDFVISNEDVLNEIVDESRSEMRQSISVATCLKSYLLKFNKCQGCGQCDECDKLWCASTLEYMYLRVATFLCMPDIQMIKDFYTLLSIGHISMATPTMFNAGLKRHQMASCFVVTIGDSLWSIEDFWLAFGEISRNAGGIGADVSRIRHSLIGEVGKSDGIPALLPTYQAILRYVDQSKKRRGSAAIFTAIWHIDIETVIKMKDPKGAESDDTKCLDLSYGVWLNDLFMERVSKQEPWSLFCPKKAPGLTETHNEEFRELYLKYEKEGRARKVISNARNLMIEIIEAQMSTGMPYILNSDLINRCNMQDNIGIIRSSNLCSEITLHTSDTEIASCNLCSLCLPKFVRDDRTFDWENFISCIRMSVRVMENVIERNYYPDRGIEKRENNRKMIEDMLQKNGILNADIRHSMAKDIVDNMETNEILPQIKKSNLANRPLGIGLQGFGDAVAKMDWLFDGEEAAEFNNRVIQTLYYYSVDESANLARQLGPYKRFPGSPYSKGELHPDRWVSPTGKKTEFLHSFENVTLDWDALREKVKGGVRHSTLLALMPTATSSIIAGNSPSMEPINCIVGTKTLLSGQHVVLCEEAYKDLNKLGVWNNRLVDEIITANKDNFDSQSGIHGVGGIQHLSIPPEIADQPLKRARFNYIKQKYRVGYELSAKTVIDHAAARTPFVCQSQSMNLWIANPSTLKLLAIYNHAWKQGLKTMVYYVRGKSSLEARNITAACKGGMCEG